jgi:hypothetical protein
MATFNISQKDAIVKHVSGAIERSAKRGMLSAALKIQAIIQTEIIPAEDPPPINTRAYAAAWGNPPVETDQGIDLVNTMPYASIIEGGARAENIKIGTAMIDALTSWVIMKGLVGRPRGAAGRQQAEQDARQIAWAIAVSMKKKGIFNRGGTGLRIAEKAAKRAPAIVAHEVAAEIKRAMGGK